MFSCYRSGKGKRTRGSDRQAGKTSGGWQSAFAPQELGEHDNERESGRVGRSGEKERERVELSDKENAKQKPWHAMENEKMRAKGSMHDFLAMGK